MRNSKEKKRSQTCWLRKRYIHIRIELTGKSNIYILLANVVEDYELEGATPTKHLVQQGRDAEPATPLTHQRPAKLAGGTVKPTERDQELKIKVPQAKISR